MEPFFTLWCYRQCEMLPGTLIQLPQVPEHCRYFKSSTVSSLPPPLSPSLTKVTETATSNLRLSVCQTKFQVHIVSLEIWLSIIVSNTKYPIIMNFQKVKPRSKHCKFQPVFQQTDSSKTILSTLVFINSYFSAEILGQSCKVAMNNSYCFAKSGKALCSCKNPGNVFVQLKIFYSFFTNCRSNTSHLSELYIHQQEGLIIFPSLCGGLRPLPIPCTMWKEVHMHEEETH